MLRLLQADAAISARNGVGRLAKLVCTMKAAWFVVAILAVAPSCFVMGQTNSASCIAAHYKVVALPLRPADVNEARQVAGTTIGHRAALWTEQSGLREVPLPGVSTTLKPCAKQFWARHRTSRLALVPHDWHLQPSRRSERTVFCEPAEGLLKITR